MRGQTMQDRDMVRSYLLLYASFLIFSASSVMNKLASAQALFSPQFFFFYVLGLLALLTYALLWQLVLKRLPLTVAYANRSIVTLLSMLWGIVLFHETLTWNMVLGAAVILLGVRMVVTENGS